MKYLVQNVYTKIGKEPGYTYESYINQIAFGSKVTVEANSPTLEFSIRRFNQTDNSFQDHIVEYDFSGLKKKEKDFRTLTFQADDNNTAYEKRILIEVV